MSVVVLLNQEHGDAGAVSGYILKRVMGVAEIKNEIVSLGPEWTGVYLDSDTGLAITVSQDGVWELLVKYHRKPQKMWVVEAYKA